jgi:hypothetical protein
LVEHQIFLSWKWLDSQSSDVNVKSTQDLLEFYSKKKNTLYIKLFGNKNNIDVYKPVEYVFKKHSIGHFVLDEVPILKTNSKCKMFYYNNH